MSAPLLLKSQLGLPVSTHFDRTRLQVVGPEAGLAQLDELERHGALTHDYWLYAVRADLEERCGRPAAAWWSRALELCELRCERLYLQKRLAAGWQGEEKAERLAGSCEPWVGPLREHSFRFRLARLSTLRFRPSAGRSEHENPK